MSTVTQSSTSHPIDHVKEADKLLTILLSYVKECQKRYGGKTELATEFDNCVAGLCSSLEKVLSHGLRTKPNQENNQNFSLKQMSDIVSNSLNFNSESPCKFRHLLLLVVHVTLLKMFKMSRQYYCLFPIILAQKCCFFLLAYPFQYKLIGSLIFLSFLCNIYSDIFTIK